MDKFANINHQLVQDDMTDYTSETMSSIQIENSDKMKVKDDQQYSSRDALRSTMDEDSQNQQLAKEFHSNLAEQRDGSDNIHFSSQPNIVPLRSPVNAEMMAQSTYHGVDSFEMDLPKAIVAHLA